MTDTVFDPRPKLGEILVELLRAGCYWQTGDLTRARRSMRKAAMALDVLRVRMDRSKEQDTLGRFR